MSVRRSPPGTPSEIEDPHIPPEYRTGHDGQSLPMRKRKQRDEDGLYENKELVAFRADILSILHHFASEQKQNMSKISADINSIKEQINGIEHKTDSMIKEQNQIKLEISNISSRFGIAELKISSIESEIETLKAATKNITTVQCEDFITELRERTVRENNIIITGVPELHSTLTKERITYDLNEATKIIKAASPDCPEPINCIRLGKYKPGNTRSLKATLSSAESAKNVLRNRLKVNTKSVNIFSDKTPKQQQHMTHLKEELQKRQNQGEDNIGIKYIKGVPRIIDLKSKN